MTNYLSCALLFFLANAISSLTSNVGLSVYVASAAAVPTIKKQHANITNESIAISSDVVRGTSIFGAGYTYNSCSSLNTCEDCTSTHTCHWCKSTESCHARGSIHGCAWGSTCSNGPPKPKDNTTCAAQTTCHDCALASRFCHWCEHDNACHAVGSRFGCAVGVDCYSNDRCRRSEAEPLPQPSSPINAVLDRVPTGALTAILLVGGVCVACLCVCRHRRRICCRSHHTTSSRGTDARAAAGPNEDDHFYTRLPDISMEVDATVEEENQPSVDSDTTAISNGDGGNDEVRADGGDIVAEETSRPPEEAGDQGNNALRSVQSEQNENREQQNQVQANEESSNPYHLMQEAQNHNNNTDRNQPGNRENEAAPLLHPSFNGDIDIDSADQPRQSQRSNRCCSMLHWLSIFTILFFVGTSLFFFPQIPVYNVCNDEVAWSEIVKKIVTFRIDAGLEILTSLSNPNRIAAALDEGKGTFSFQGKQFGTYVIPPMTVQPMSITDFMIIVHITPADRHQAFQLAEAFYHRTLILEAEFEGTIRVPALFNLTQDVSAQNITVDINEISDRSLCHCPTWDGDKNHSIDSLLKLMEDQWSIHFNQWNPYR